MSNQNEIIRQLFKYLPNTKISFDRLPDGIILSFGAMKIFIKSDDTFDKVKNKIDKRRESGKECGICYETTPMMTCCLECSNRICFGCHIILTIDNNGKNVCSFCRHSSGNGVNPEELVNRTNDLLRSINDEKYFYYVRQRISNHLN